jgi:hypothetical protein
MPTRSGLACKTKGNNINTSSFFIIMVFWQEFIKFNLHIAQSRIFEIAVYPPVT